jgi:hypothetical protein
MVAHSNLGPSKVEMQLQLMDDKRTTASDSGGVTLISQGLKIEDSQYACRKLSISIHSRFLSESFFLLLYVELAAMHRPKKSSI